MNSDILQKARDFEAQYALANEQIQPAFHVTGGIGWINDPNGFSLYQGRYHLFFQYHPYSNRWGPMHWGHVTTTDFIRWEHLPAALAPDCPYDKAGCFSGSAIETPDGKHLIVYTGVREGRTESGIPKPQQTQCIAIGDGVDYAKLPENPVIDAQLLPPGGSTEDFRDPNIWREGDTYYLVVGNRGKDGSGDVLLYKSDDALHWSFVSIVASCHHQYGAMWECPDLFSLDDADVLLFSCQEMETIGLEFHPGNATVCIIGHIDRERMHMIREHVQAIDYGLDFYATQTVLTPDGRRVMIAWMQSWEGAQGASYRMPFFGQMTIPRELHVRNGRLCQLPVRELEAYRGVRIEYPEVFISEECSLPGVRGRFLDLTVHVRPVSPQHIYQSFRIKLAKDGEHYASLRYRPSNNTVRFDRTHSGFAADVVHVRDFLVRPRDGEIKLRIILDRYSVEVFVNDGEQAASFVLFTPVEAGGISFAADGMALVGIESYALELPGAN